MGWYIKHKICIFTDAEFFLLYILDNESLKFYTMFNVNTGVRHGYGNQKRLLRGIGRR